MSPLLSWTPIYSVNNDELDSHHQKMFHILNTIYENVMNSREVDCVLTIIDELLALVRTHVSLEEQIMNEKCYPDIDAHVATHNEFLHEIERLRSNHYDNDLEATNELIIVLGNWLLHHVINEDSKYSGLLID